jgi:ABC-type Fe3+ transport system substrate-binding protein
MTITVALVFCAALGCDRAPESAAQTLIIISPHRDEIRQEVEQGFAEWLQRRPRWQGTQVQLQWRDLGGGSSQILRYLTAQYQATPESCGIDLLYGGGTDLYYDLQPKGILAPFQLPEKLRNQLRLELHGVELRDPGGHWFGVMLSSLGILYNREVLDRLGMPDWYPPKSWRDLGDPRLLGWVSAGDPRMSGSVHMLYEWLLQRYGWDEGFRMLMRLGANAHGFARFSDGVSRDVLFGKTAAGGTLDSYGFSALAREQRAVQAGKAERAILGLVLPKGEVVLNPDSIGILKGAPHRALAEAFVEYNLSEDGGQQLWSLQPMADPGARARFPGSPHRYAICRLSLMERLYDNKAYPESVRSVSVNPFDEAAIGPLPKKYDNKVAERRRRALQDLFGAWIIDTHDDLQAAWRAVRNCPSPDRERLEQELCAPPCSEQEIFDVKDRLGNPPDARLRAKLLSGWLNDARERYRQVQVAVSSRK